MGGSDDPSNLIELTVKEHAEAHLWLWLKYGHWKDRAAWKGLSGKIGKEEIIKEKSIEGGRISGNIAVKSGQVQAMGRKYGKTNGNYQGKKNVESGHLAKVRNPSKAGKAHTGMKWINNDNIETYVKQEKLTNYLSLGYVLGRLKKKKNGDSQ
jgi:hypothetical protein